MDIFVSVKARVGVREAAKRYGVRVNGRGMRGVRSTMTGGRAYMWTAATSTVSPAGRTGTASTLRHDSFGSHPLRRRGSWRRTLGLLRKNRRNTTKHSGSGKTSGCAFAFIRALPGAQAT